MLVSSEWAYAGAELSEMAAKGRYHEDVFGVMVSAKAARQTRASLASKKAELLQLAELIRADDAPGKHALDETSTMRWNESVSALALDLRSTHHVLLDSFCLGTCAQCFASHVHGVRDTLLELLCCSLFVAALSACLSCWVTGLQDNCCQGSTLDSLHL